MKVFPKCVLYRFTPGEFVNLVLAHVDIIAEKKDQLCISKSNRKTKQNNE